MQHVFDAFWRAVAYCLHPRVILWSLLPLALAGALVGGVGWLYWESSVAAVRGTLEQWSLVQSMLQWLDSIGANQLRTLLAPMIVVALAVPLVVLLSLLLVAVCITPLIVRLVAQRRFPTLERREGAAWWQGLLWSLACTAAALLALMLSVPLWLVPPLVLLIPPLIWGWLTYRVLGFDVLALHASAAERRHLLRSRGWTLLMMGVVCGYLGAVPSLLWAASVVTLILAPVLVLLSVWLYTLVFVFSACWFAHYLLALLQEMRTAETVAPLSPVTPVASPQEPSLYPAALPPPATGPLSPATDPLPPAPGSPPASPL